MSTKTPSTKEEWAATKENPLLETAVLYESESSSKCGHAVPLAPLVDRLEKCTTCPICQATVEVVCDGMAKPKESSNAKIVTFKYRKHLFRLSVAAAEDPSANHFSLPYSLCLWMWHRFLVFAGEEVGFTAQERIAQVLRMDLHGGMRILHKGKILYPNAQQSSQAISEQLLDVCDKGGKPMVMGTRLTEQEQKIATLKWCYNLFYRIVEAFVAKAIGMARGMLSHVTGGRGGAGGAAIQVRPHRD